MTHLVSLLISIGYGYFASLVMTAVLDSASHLTDPPLVVAWFFSSVFLGALLGGVLQRVEIGRRFKALCGLSAGLSVALFAPSFIRAGGDPYIPALLMATTLPLGGFAVIVGMREKVLGDQAVEL